MVAQMRADVVFDTMMTIARKIEGMDIRLTEGQVRLEKRLRDDIAEVRSELKADIAIVAENTHSLNRKLNILLTHMGLSE